MREPRRIEAGLRDVPTEVDLLVVGLGVTGAGVALDAVTRGLSVLAVDAHDLAFGTSRWSSKLVHGGLRYLAHGQVGVAYECAVERGVLMETTAPHLTRPLPSLIPLTPEVTRVPAFASWAGLRAGDLLRRTAHTSARTLPAPRRLSAAETHWIAPGLRTAGLRGSLLSWDGQLEDDARLVITIARTAAQRGATVRTRGRVVNIEPPSKAATAREAATTVRLRDELTATSHEVRARAVVNATGIWAGELVGDVQLRPSRGSHLLLRPESLPGLDVAIFAPIPAERGRFVLVVPRPDGLICVGITDEPVDGPIPDVPSPTEREIEFLLGTVAASFDREIRRDDVAGVFAGLRPLLAGDEGSTADLSRRHATISGRSGVVTIVGGKLTTYRRMAEDAVDAALAHSSLDAGPCVTKTVALTGAAPRATLAEHAAQAGSRGAARLVRRYGADADLVAEAAEHATGLHTDELLAPIARDQQTVLAEFVFAITHEGATTVEDLLDRRTRIGLVPAQRAGAVAAAERALALVSGSAAASAP